MSPRPYARHRIHRLAAGPVLAAALGALLAAGCTTNPAASSPPTPSPEASGSATAAPSPVTMTPPPATPTTAPTEAPASTTPSPDPDLPASPPRALLADAHDGSVPGALGSYTWGDGGSDSPWIILRASRAATGAGPWTLSFEPEIPVGTWTAAWAAIRDDRPGQIAGYEQGATGQIAFAGPAGAGPWTLKVEVTFVGGGGAVYYWRLEPAR